jgi:hypothetical protein
MSRLRGDTRSSAKVKHPKPGANVSPFRGKAQQAPRHGSISPGAGEGRVLSDKRASPYLGNGDQGIGLLLQVEPGRDRATITHRSPHSLYIPRKG